MLAEIKKYHVRIRISPDTISIKPLNVYARTALQTYNKISDDGLPPEENEFWHFPLFSQRLVFPPYSYLSLLR